MHDVIKKEEVKWPIIVGYKNIIIQHVKTLKKMIKKKVDNFINQNRKQINYKKLPLKSSKITQIIYKHKQ